MRSPASRVLLLTGAVMRSVALRALGCRPCVWRPQHSSKLGNEFFAYSSYDAAGLGGWDSTLPADDEETAIEGAGAATGSAGART